jgi:glyoxylase-like metal-dependent hydrolase (beta-lactamase superfamily II)
MRLMLLAMLLALPVSAETLETLSAFETVKVADGVHAFIARQTESPLVSGNSLVVIGDDGVLVVDTGHFPSGTRKMIAQIRKLTPLPVRFVVNTHWHGDHNAGNSVYAEAFPRAVFISTKATREAFETEAPKYEPQTLQQQLPALREALRTGKTRKGTALSESQRTYYTRVLEETDSALPDMLQSRHLAPSLTFDKELTIFLGKREVRILFLGRANTAGDAVVYLPDVKVLATGDLVVYPVPYAFGSFMGEWAKTMDALLQIDAVALVPGHGPLMHDKAYPLLVKRIVESLTVQAASLKTETLEAARKKLDVKALRDELTKGDPQLNKDFDSFVLEPGFARAYREANEGPLHDEN